MKGGGGGNISCISLTLYLPLLLSVFPSLHFPLSCLLSFSFILSVLRLFSSSLLPASLLLFDSACSLPPLVSPHTRHPSPWPHLRLPLFAVTLRSHGSWRRGEGENRGGQRKQMWKQKGEEMITRNEGERRRRRRERERKK